MRNLPLQDSLSVDVLVETSRSIVSSSYDLASGGIPPHAWLLESMAKDAELDDYSRRTFLSLDSSNLLAIPGITMRAFPGDAERQAAYFGERLSNEILTGRKEIAQIASEGEGAIIRHCISPEAPLNFSPISAKELPGIIEQYAEKGYISHKPNLPVKVSGRSFTLTDLMITVYNNGGGWTENAVEALFKNALENWFSTPFLCRAIELHLKKTGLMRKLLACTIERMEQTGFANPNEFNSQSYFESGRNDMPAEKWNEAFRKYFGIPAPSARGLLEWADSALAAARARYGVK